MIMPSMTKRYMVRNKGKIEVFDYGEEDATCQKDH